MAALCLLAALAVLSLIASDLPRAYAWLSAAAALAAGAWGIRRELHRPACLIVIAADGQATVDGHAVEGLSVEWRGPLAFLRWRDTGGRVQRCSFWPDTLPAGPRRELRLAAPTQPGAPGLSGMAH